MFWNAPLWLPHAHHCCNPGTRGHPKDSGLPWPSFQASSYLPRPIRAGFFLSREPAIRARRPKCARTADVSAGPWIFLRYIRRRWWSGFLEQGWEGDIMRQLRSGGEFMGGFPARPSTRRPAYFTYRSHGALGKSSMIPAQRVRRLPAEL